MKAPIIESWTEIEDSYIIDIPRGATRPKTGKPWVYYVFGWDVERRKLKHGVKEFAKRSMITISQPTKRKADAALKALFDSGARLVPEGSRRK